MEAGGQWNQKYEKSRKQTEMVENPTILIIRLNVIFFLFLTLFLTVLGSHCCGFSCCGAWTLDVWASVVVAPELSCPVACGIFLDQGSNPCPLHWQEDS